MPVVLIGYYFIGSKTKACAILWLAISSIFFYGYWNYRSLPILIISIAFNYLIGSLLISKKFEFNKIICIVGILLNLAALGYFKYLNFFLENLNTIKDITKNDNINSLEIILPLGISFYTFTQIGYLIDCYQNIIKKNRFIDYCLFVTFFPHLIAGPLIHHKNIVPQFNNNEIFRPNLEKISIGIIIFTLGLCKKVFLADNFAHYADFLFNGVEAGVNPSLIPSWIGTVSFTLQIYFDFSGYSDMAVGISLLFGIVLPVNFNSPLRSTSIIEFWQKWHITLTGYIKNYLYTPIAIHFMRIYSGKSSLLQLIITVALPTLITFIIIGLWHGASWNFILFGLLNGVFIIVNNFWRIFYKRFKRVLFHLPKISVVLSWALTFISFNVSLVLFRSDSFSSALNVYKGMLGINNFYIPNFFYRFLQNHIPATYFGNLWPEFDFYKIPSSLTLFIVLTVSFILILTPSNSNKDFILYLDNMPPRNFLFGRFAALLFAFAFVAACLKMVEASPFIYFNF